MNQIASVERLFEHVKRDDGVPVADAARRCDDPWMCGRFAMDQKTNDLITAFVLDGNDYRDWRPAYSIAPTEVAPIVRERLHESGELVRTVEPAVWDFWPIWQDAAKKARNQFNSRIEALTSSGLWRHAFASQRAVVPMRGYFEWTGQKGNKDAHFLHGRAPMLAAAGIYTPRRDDDGTWTLTFSVITRQARDASGEVHDRMPALLTQDAIDPWLQPVPLDTPNATAELLGLLWAASEEVAATIASYRVGREVNNTRTVPRYDPSLITPLT